MRAQIHTQKTSVHCSARALLSICTWLRRFKHTSYSSSSLLRGDAFILVLFKLFLIWCQQTWGGMSAGMSASHCLSVFLFPLLGRPDSLTFTSSSRAFLSHISVSFCLSYFHLFSQMFFLLLWAVTFTPFIIPQSFVVTSFFI